MVQVAPLVHKDFAQRIQNEINNGKVEYEVIKNKDSFNRVNQTIQTEGLDKQLYLLESKLDEGKHLTKDDIVMGERLIQKYIKVEDSEKAMYAVTLTAEAGTQAGQMLQVMSMIRKLTSECQLMVLNHITKKLTYEYVKTGEKEREKDIFYREKISIIVNTYYRYC